MYFESGAKPNIATIEPISTKTSTQAQSPTPHSITTTEVLGIVVALIAIAILLHLIFWMRRKRKFPFKNAASADLQREDSVATTKFEHRWGCELVESGFVPKGRHELQDPNPAAHELSPDAQIHEMFDESMCREMRNDRSPTSAAPKKVPSWAKSNISALRVCGISKFCDGGSFAAIPSRRRNSSRNNTLEQAWQ